MAGLSMKRTHEVLERRRARDAWAAGVNAALMALVLANILAVIVESEQAVYSAYAPWFDGFEYVSAAVFAVEYGLRVWSAPMDRRLGSTPWRRRLRYVFSLYGLVDLIAIAPSLLAYFMPSIDLRFLRALRLLRVLKFTHYSHALQDLWLAVHEERRAFMASLYVLGVAIILSSTMMYLVEHRAQPEHFASIPRAMWWSVITLTTVGYGDVSPVTALGQFLGAIVALMGVCTVALITGILASSFAVQMDRRKREFDAQFKLAMADGVLSDEEIDLLIDLKHHLGVTSEEFERLRLRVVQRKQRRREAAADPTRAT